MDNSVKDPKLIPTQGISEKIHKSSAILFVVTMLLMIALFVRIETVVHETRMTESKFAKEIQQIKDALKEVVNKDLDAASGR